MYIVRDETINNEEFNDSNIDKIFDNAVISDIRFVLENTSVFPENNINNFRSKQEDIVPLKYDSQNEYYNFKFILEDKNYSENEKIEFLKQALNDSSQKGLEYILKTTSSFFFNSEEARKIIDDCFQYNQNEILKNDSINKNYLFFKLYNDYPDSEKLIDHYFDSTRSDFFQFDYEIFFIKKLIEIKKQEKAVKYLQLIIDKLDWKNSSTLEKVFEELCFSENDNISKTALDLLFQYLRRVNKNTTNFYKISSYIDVKRHSEILKLWFDFYKSIDYSSVKPEDLNSYQRSELAQNYIYFTYFLVSNSEYLALIDVVEFWKYYHSFEKYWRDDTSYPFQRRQLAVIKDCFKNDSISYDYKREILFNSCKEFRLFEDREYLATYLQLVIEAYPDLRIPKKDFEQLELNKSFDYSSPFDFSRSLLKIWPRYRYLYKNEVAQLISDINLFCKSASLNEIENTKLNNFRFLEKSAENVLIETLNDNGITAGTDPEFMYSPSDYYSFFESSLKPLLTQKGINNIEVRQITQKIENDNYESKIYVKFQDQIFCHEFTEDEYSSFSPQRIVKAINLLLIKNQIKERFIELATAGYFLFVLIQPSILKTISNQCQIRSLAVHYDDEFSLIPWD
ncbi:hypothetical protein [Flavobacterium notoginsengisoli]|uniref:hypothetical protein n=1 Tax=Flavobacterium notoginsengisoli TaxID=1478199 RepID=UPI0036271AD2